MSAVERKEYQETKIMRTVSPVRNYRSLSSQNLAEFDHNLDYLLEDLQNSVSRPGSSLGQHPTTQHHTSRNVNTIESANNRSSSLNRYANVKPSNPVVDYSSDDAYNYTSPDGSKRVAAYKKEIYSYKTSGGGETVQAPERTRMQRSINQLDTLLDDLQQVKNSSCTESDSYNNAGADPDFNRNTGLSSSKRSVHRELHYGDTPRAGSRSQTLERSSERESSLTRDVQYSSEGTYGDIRQIRSTSPSPSSRTSTLSKQAKVKNVHTYPMEVIETVAPEINPEVLAHLDPSLHPPGNTKVTTTIKTYTYEIPGSGTYPTDLTIVDSVVDSSDKSYVYSPNQTQSTPSKSFVYKKVENKSSENTVNYINPPVSAPPVTPESNSWQRSKVYRETTTADSNHNYPPYEKPAPPVGFKEKPPSPGFTPTVTSVPPGGHTVIKETVTTRNYQPGYSPETVPPRNQQTYIYNETVTTKNVNDNTYPRPSPQRQDTYIVEENRDHVTNRVNYPPSNDRDYPPPRQETYIIKEIHDRNTTTNTGSRYPQTPPPQTTTYIKEVHDNTTTNIVNNQTQRGPSPYQNGYPPQQIEPSPRPTNKTVIYKHETHTTKNNYGGPGAPGTGSRPPTGGEVESFDPNHPPYHPQSGKGRPGPNEPVNIQYRYKSESHTTNNYKAGYPPGDDSQTLLPGKFPTDVDSQLPVNGGPPKKLDELMATIGREPPNSPYNSSFTAHEIEMEQRKKVEAMKQQQADAEDLQQKKEPLLKSKPITGAPVYYPPGHEMFAKKEEAGAAWRAQGAYARGSGKYEYESESKSKTKSSSGAAIVPVCLPLCCGLPCTII